MNNKFQISWVLEACRPKELAWFYSKIFFGEIQEGKTNNHWLVLCPNGIKIQIYRPSFSRDTSIKGRAMAPCLEAVASSNPLTALHKLIFTLEEMGAVLLEEPKIEDFGAESWMADPEGNAFLILVPFP